MLRARSGVTHHSDPNRTEGGLPVFAHTPSVASRGYCDEQWCGAVVLGLVGIGTRVEEQGDSVMKPILAGIVKWRVATHVFSVRRLGVHSGCQLGGGHA
eukprot:scaffold913_cov73-Phaeocystis_antarctica.AAC.10